MSLDFGLRDVHVLISGASGGIGLEIVKTFQQLGAKITAHYNSQAGPLANLEKVTPLQADVRDQASIQTLFNEATRQNGPISILIVNHAVSPPADVPLADMDLSRWQSTIDINLTGSFLLAQAYLRQLRSAPTSVKDTANIVFVGSTAGKFGEANHADYAASKSGIMYGLVASLKNEIVTIAPRARVNAVNPGWTATSKKEAMLGQRDVVERILATVPLQKVAEPRDIARQIAVVASSVLSGHVSGMNFFVDGGMEGRLLFPPKGEA